MVRDGWEGRRDKNSKTLAPLLWQGEGTIRVGFPKPRISSELNPVLPPNITPSPYLAAQQSPSLVLLSGIKDSSLLRCTSITWGPAFLSDFISHNTLFTVSQV